MEICWTSGVNRSHILEHLLGELEVLAEAAVDHDELRTQLRARRSGMAARTPNRRAS